MKYTVLLLRPDYVASNFGQDTYLAHVDEPSVEAAVHTAKVRAADADGLENFSDYYPLVTLTGHHDDLTIR